MGNYVRTKNGIYDLNSNFKVENNILFEDVSATEGSMSGTEEWRCCDKVIKESAIPETLCDEFVFILNHSEIGKENEYMMIKRSNLEYFKLLVKDIKNSALYGAIWTSKGLIYVIKMSDKGDWEII